MRLVPALGVAVSLTLSGCATLPGSGRADEIARLEAEIRRLRQDARVLEVENRRLREAASSHRRADATPVESRADVARPEPLPPTRTGTPAPAPIETEDLVAEDLDDEALDLGAPTTTSAPPPPETAPPPARVPSTSAQALYDRAYSLFHQGEYASAESEFENYLGLYPETRLADNAQFWIGESRFARGEIEGALDAFRRTVERFPDGNKVPDSMVKAGKCLEALGDAEGARATYREVVRIHAGTAAAAIAEERLLMLP